MSEQTEYFRAINQHRQQERRQQKETNTTTLQQAGLTFRVANNGECLVFREQGKPWADFYPSTGRWRLVERSNRSSRSYSGGADAFLRWYTDQKAPK